MTVTVQVRGDQYVVDYLATLPVSVLKLIYDKFSARASSISAYIKDDLLSGRLLNVKTGRLRSSIVARTYTSKAKVTLSVASRGNVPYAAIYEYGGKLPPHIIRSKTGKLLSFIGKTGERVFPEEVNHPGSNVIARAYLQKGVTDKYVDFLSDIGNAIYDASRTVQL